MTPFLYAARSGDVTVMKLLLAHGADPKIPTFGGTTALMAAAGINWVVDQTYDEGAPALARSREAVLRPRHERQRYELHGTDCHHGAANRGSDEIIKFLVEKGAKLDVKDKEGRTPLNWAEGVFLATHPAEAEAVIDGTDQEAHGSSEIKQNENEKYEQTSRVSCRDIRILHLSVQAGAVRSSQSTSREVRLGSGICGAGIHESILFELS